MTITDTMLLAGNPASSIFFALHPIPRDQAQVGALR
jgi:hypothetical protein